MKKRVAEEAVKKGEGLKKWDGEGDNSERAIILRVKWRDVRT